MAAPLLNPYTAQFALYHRLIPTISGGLFTPLPDDSGKRSLFDTIIATVLRLFAWSAPWVISDVVSPSTRWGGLVDSLLVGGCVSVLYCGLRSVMKSSSTLQLEFDEWEDERGGVILRCLRMALYGGSRTVQRSAGPSKGLSWIKVGRAIVIAVQGVSVGTFIACCRRYLSTDVLENWFGDEQTGIWVVHVFGWITTLTAWWALLGLGSTDPNTYDSDDLYSLDDLSRPFHISLILTMGFLETSISSLNFTNQCLAIIYAFLPLIWTLGILPSFSISLNYLAEILVVHMFGGTPTFSNVHLLLQGLQGTVCVIAVACVGILESERGGIVLASGVGAVSASSFWIQWNGSSHAQQHSLIALARGFVSVGIATTHFASWNENVWSSILITVATTSGILLVVFVVLRELDKPFILFRALRNPFVRQNQGFLFNNTVSRTRAAIRAVLLPLSALIALQALFHLELNRAGSRPQENASPSETLEQVFEWVFVFRAFRQVWQFPTSCALEVTVLSIMDQVTFGATWRSLGNFGARLWIISLSRTFLCGFCDRLWVYLISWYYFLYNKKERKHFWYLYVAAFAPIGVLVVFAASVLNVPMLLALGLPVFWVGFPRPTRQWPDIGTNTGAFNPDGELYVHDANALRAPLACYFQSLVDPSRAVLLIRIEGRRALIAWPVEIWSDMMGVCMKGLELQPTSCHALEMTRVDDILDGTFELRHEMTNRFWLSGFQAEFSAPIITVTDSRNLLAGVFDDRDTVKALPAVFFKVLVWFLLKDPVEIRGSDAPVPSTVIMANWKKFPAQWTEFLEHEGFLAPVNGEEDFALLITATYSIALGYGWNPSHSPDLSPERLWRIFSGSLPNTPEAQWLQAPAQCALLDRCIMSFRYALFIVYESVTTGASDVIETYSDLFLRLEDLYTAWYIGPDPMRTEASPHCREEWIRMLRRNEANRGLFGLSYSGQDERAIGAGRRRRRASTRVSPVDGARNMETGGLLESRQLYGRMLRTDEVSVMVGSLNIEAVKGIWANLVWEIYYLTNDDDERFSIQSHELLFRNIIIQAANPPLGYPVYVDNVQCIL